MIVLHFLLLPLNEKINEICRLNSLLMPRDGLKSTNPICGETVLSLMRCKSQSMRVGEAEA